MNALYMLREEAAQDALRILSVMPHRYPMLLVDSAEECFDAASTVAYKNITLNEPCYRHVGAQSSEQDLAYPLGLLIESFGQGAGLLLARRGFLKQAGSTRAVVFGEFEDIELVGDAFPGERLRHEVRLLQASRSMAILGGRTVVGQRLIAHFGRLKAYLVPTQMIAREAQ